MGQLKEIFVDDNIYHLEYFLGGYWKFLACVCGIGAANAEYACIWCICPKLKRYDTGKSWSLLDPESGARTLDEIKKCAKAKKFNCIHVLLFPFISLNHVVIDTLHLYLSKCDNLIQLFIRELKIGDSIDKKKTYSHNLSRDKYEHMAGYESYLQSLGIPFHWYVGKETKQLEYRDLTGPEKVFTFSGPVKSRYSTSTISKFHPFCQIHQTVELSKKFGMISEVLQKI